MSDRDSKDFYRENMPLLVKLLQVDKTNCIHHGYYEKASDHIYNLFKT